MGYLSSYSGQEIDEGISINNTQNDRLTVIETQLQSLNNKIYPVGSIYISINSTSPASLFGGTWEQLKDRFLLSAGDSYTAGSTGGAASVTLTVEQIPAHNHQINYNVVYRQSVSSGGGVRNVVASGTDSLNTDDKGSGKSHNNMPPYLTVYMWKRIS